MLKQISDIVLEAGEIVKTGFFSNKNVKYKGEVDLVTEYDVKTEEFLKEKLQKLFPDFKIIGEETNSDKNEYPNENVIFIDPIDGTTNFVHGVPFVAVSVGVITEKEGKPGTLSLTRALQSRDFLENQIKAVEEEMEEVIRTEDSLSRNYHLLLSIKGIGKVNAIQTLVHTNNFKGFETARQYADYLGIAPHGSTSGTSVRVDPHISHIGPKLLRAELSQAANSAIAAYCFFEKKPAIDLSFVKDRQLTMF